MTVVAIGARVKVPSTTLGETFYVDGFGLKIVEFGVSCLVTKSNQGYLVLEADPTLDTSPPTPRTTGLIFAAQGMHSLWRRLEQLVARRIREGEAAWGGHEFVMVDPFGNEFSLYSSGG